MEYYIAVLVGCLLYILFQLNGVYNNPKFRWKEFVKTNWIPVLINLVVGVALVYTKDTLVDTLKGAAIVGFSGQVLWKKITDVFDKDKNTVVNL